MGMDDGMNVGPRLEDSRMNKSLKVERPALIAHRLPIEPELDDIARLDQFGGKRTRQKEMVWIVGIAQTDMAVRIDDVLPRENTVGDDEVFDQRVKIGHGTRSSELFELS